MASGFFFSSSNKRVLWFWQSNASPWKQNETKQWSRYSDFEVEHIEEAFQNGQKESELNDYVINFEQKIQFKKTNPTRQRPVKREEVDSSQYVREERFGYTERAVPKSFEDNYEEEHNFTLQWESKNRQISGDNNYRGIAEAAAQGKASFSDIFIYSVPMSIENVSLFRYS